MCRRSMTLLKQAIPAVWSEHTFGSDLQGILGKLLVPHLPWRGEPCTQLEALASLILLKPLARNFLVNSGLI